MATEATNNKLLSVYINATEINTQGVIWLTQKGIILGVNSSFAEQVGYEKEALNGKMIFEINPHLSLMAWRKLWKQLLKEQQVIIEAEHLTASDELFPVKVRWELIEIEGKQYGCGIVEDLIAANRYEDLLNIASEISRVAVWEWDVIRQEFFFTQQFNRLLNFSEDIQLNRANIEVFLGRTLSSQSFKKLQTETIAAIKSGEPFELELELRPRDKVIITALNLTAKPLFIEERTVKIYGTIQDLSSISGRTDEMYLTTFCMEYGQECILWVNDKGQVIYANQAAALTYDYTQEEFKTKTVFDFVVKFRNKEVDYQKHWQDLAEKGMMEYESIHFKKDGHLFPVWISHNYITYQNQSFNCLFIKDLTDQKVQENRWKLTQFTVDKAGEMIFWVREDGCFEYVNDKACEVLGYTIEEIYTIDPFSISGDFPKKEWPKVWAAFVANKQLDFETNYYRKDGTTLPVAISANYIEFEDKILCCSFVRDLSFKKASDEKLKLSMSTIEKASDMFFWLDEQANIFYANTEAARNLGYSAMELEGISLFKIAPSRNKKNWSDFWERIKTQQHLVYEGLMKRKNGKVFPVEITINFIIHEGKEMLSAYTKDITDRTAKTLKLEMAYDEINRLKEAAEEENTILKDEIQLEYGFNNIISTSDSYKKVLRKVEQVADSDATVLILGETGTGKELLARAVHELSARSERTMIKVNCGALPANLIESELFGHERGAFTGAHQAKKGRFELAHRGTIFLDEIGELPLDLQSKLLRVLQEGEFEKLGGTKTVNVNVRVIAATNRNLEQKIAEKSFREDLFYRLNVFPIYNIPLRERKEDIALLVRFFVDKYSKKMGKKIKEIPQKALKQLEAYNFPGNVRELENIIERSIILTTEERLSFDTTLFRSTPEKKEAFFSLEDVQRNHIIEALRLTKGRISGEKGAATLLEINDKTLTSRIKKLNINRADYLDF